MSKTKHTPGPWYSSNDDRCIYAKLETVDGTYVEPLVAQCSKHTTSANANAALIAAAPEMFEVLEKILDIEYAFNTDGVFNAEIEKIKDVLKKARGEK